MNSPAQEKQIFKKIEGDISGKMEIRCRTVLDILAERSPLEKNLREHILKWFLNPDKGSSFDKKTRLFRNWIPRRCIIPLMALKRYDGMIALFGEQIIGHAFFQAHKKNTELHLFSIAVAEQLRKRKVSMFIGKSFIEHGRTQPNIAKLKFSGGGDPNIDKTVYDAIRAIFRRISQMAGGLGIETDDQFFVSFLDRNPRELIGIIEPRKENEPK